MKVYPSTRYHPQLGHKLVKNAEEDARLVGWFESPADFGVETCPGKVPDPVIAERRAKFAPPKAVPAAQDEPDNNAALEEVEEVIHQAEAKLQAMKKPSMRKAAGK
jgi:hypothetical protein